MVGSKNKNELRLQELVGAAKDLNIEVRAEKLLRDIGYRVRSGRCRVNGQEIIFIDRDAPLSDQIQFLRAELAKNAPHPQPAPQDSDAENT
ncbi:MAG TPA: hypothetical protein VIB79_29770 [Candidatus Binatia bacterium]|jgi:hypothetical protein